MRILYIRHMIIHKYLRFLVNFMANKKLSVTILYKGISI